MLRRWIEAMRDDVLVAFRRFTAGISSWWPLKTHSVGEERTGKVVFQEKVRGTIHAVELKASVAGCPGGNPATDVRRSV